jgi:hypothetical protein
VDNIAGFTCLCPDSYFGKTCATQTDFCAAAPVCKNGATCVSAESGWSCICPLGWSGRSCSDYVDPCAIQPCLNGGTCSVSDDSIRCECALAYSGDFCDVFHATPKAVRANVADDLSGVVVAFDAETNLRGDLPCGDYLNSSLLGSDTKCLWGADPVLGASLLFLTCPSNAWYSVLPLRCSPISYTIFLPLLTYTTFHPLPLGI